MTFLHAINANADYVTND